MSSQAIAWFSAGHFSHVDAIWGDGADLLGARNVTTRAASALACAFGRPIMRNSAGECDSASPRPARKAWPGSSSSIISKANPTIARPSGRFSSTARLAVRGTAGSAPGTAGGGAREAAGLDAEGSISLRTRSPRYRLRSSRAASQVPNGIEVAPWKAIVIITSCRAGLLRTRRDRVAARDRAGRHRRDAHGAEARRNTSPASLRRVPGQPEEGSCPRQPSN